MRKRLILLALLAGPLPAQAEDRWHCSVSERIDGHLSAYLETVLGEPGAPRRHVDFYVSWSQQPGHMAEQQMSWIAIPAEATLLWKPDRIMFGISGDRTDEEGYISFRSTRAPVISPIPARSMVRSLRPHFPITRVTVEEAALRARLWAGAEWSAEYQDQRGVALGRVRLALPPESTVQPIFARLRAELARKAADPIRSCREIPQPTREELEEQLIHRGTRIARPELEGAVPILVIDDE